MTLSHPLLDAMRAAPLRNRERLIYEYVTAPEYQRPIGMSWTELIMDSQAGPVFLNVASDYFHVVTRDPETDREIRVYLPVLPGTAQAIADRYGWALPTKAIVDAIVHDKRTVRLPFRPHDPAKRNVDTLISHSFETDEDRRKDPGATEAALYAGHGKDIVLAAGVTEYKGRGRPRMAIYGWHGKDRLTPVQDLNPRDHDIDYWDYSHHERFVQNFVTFRGQVVMYDDALGNPAIASVISTGDLRHGIQPHRRYAATVFR